MTDAVGRADGADVIMDFGPPPSSDLMGEADWARIQRDYADLPVD